MAKSNRRQWLAGVTAASVAGCSRPESLPPEAIVNGLDLTQYEPKSMLHVPETSVPAPRFPVIDIHTHLSFASDEEETIQFPAPGDELLPVMDRKNIRTMINLTGGHGKALEEAIAKLQKPHPDRFLVCVEPHYSKANEPGYAQLETASLKSAHEAGAIGLKVLKTIGLYLRENGNGALLKVDDPRFDPMWETAGALGMPVFIHTSDPEAFFLPIDRFNERWEELHAHPDWSFHGRDFPSDRELQESRFRVVEKHPETDFLVLHMGNAENLPYISEAMEKYPNMYVEFGARIGELGRQPRTARKFFERWQDRIMFGTDAIPRADNYPQQVFGDKLYEIYYRFLETEDEYFDYAPSAVPPQGRWKIHGLGLPESILIKVYHDNAARLLKLT